VGTRRPQDILGRKEVPSMSKMKSKSSKGTSFQPIWTVFLDVHIVQGQRWLHLGRPGNVPVSTEFIFIKKSLNINLLSLLRFRSWKLFSRQLIHDETIWVSLFFLQTEKLQYLPHENYLPSEKYLAIDFFVNLFKELKTITPITCGPVVRTPTFA